MPRHDIPDGSDPDSNLIDFRDYLRRRGERAAPDEGEQETEAADREVFRHAEYADGKRPGFSRYDLIWVAMILAIGWVIWVVFTSRT